MAERLQKFLSRSGVASRRHAEALITAGRVKVNGKPVTTLGTKVEPTDRVEVDGRRVEASEARVYVLLHKPYGTVTTAEDPQGRATVVELLKKELPDVRLFPVGRLDYDAEGALLLTNDGELANRLMHPRFEVPRTYLAKVKGTPSEQALEKLRGGVRLEDGMAKPTRVEVFEPAEKNTWMLMVVTEGRHHLVKRLFAAIGHPVVRLFRPAYGGLGLGDLPPGGFRVLTADEVARIRDFAAGQKTDEPVLQLPPRRHGRG